MQNTLAPFVKTQGICCVWLDPNSLQHERRRLGNTIFLSRQALLQDVRVAQHLGLAFIATGRSGRSCFHHKTFFALPGMYLPGWWEQIWAIITAQQSCDLASSVDMEKSCSFRTAAPRALKRRVFRAKPANSYVLGYEFYKEQEQQQQMKIKCLFFSLENVCFPNFHLL